MTLPLLRPTVAEVDLKKLSRNLHKIKMGTFSFAMLNVYPKILVIDI